MIYLYYFSIYGFQRHEMQVVQTVGVKADVQDCRVKMDDRITILFLKEAGNEEEFVCLMFQHLFPLFREDVRQNNG